MGIRKFIFSKQFLKHLGLAIVVVNIVFWGSLYILDFYTKHGETVPVPDLKLKSIAEAKKITEAAGLELVLNDSIFLTDKPRGSIVDQNPPANFKVKTGRKIFITINGFLPERIKMPYVVGVSLRQAKATLETYGLIIGKTIYVPDIAKDYVLEQKFKGKSIKEGDLIEKGSKIDLVLGKGEEPDSTQTSKNNDEENQ